MFQCTGDYKKNLITLKLHLTIHKKFVYSSLQYIIHLWKITKNTLLFNFIYLKILTLYLLLLCLILFSYMTPIPNFIFIYAPHALFYFFTCPIIYFNFIFFIFFLFFTVPFLFLFFLIFSFPIFLFLFFHLSFFSFYLFLFFYFIFNFSHPTIIFFLILEMRLETEKNKI